MCFLTGTGVLTTGQIWQSSTRMQMFGHNYWQWKTCWVHFITSLYLLSFSGFGIWTQVHIHICSAGGKLQIVPNKQVAVFFHKNTRRHFKIWRLWKYWKTEFWLRCKKEIWTYDFNFCFLRTCFFSFTSDSDQAEVIMEAVWLWSEPLLLYDSTLFTHESLKTLYNSTDSTEILADWPLFLVQRKYYCTPSKCSEMKSVKYRY